MAPATSDDPSQSIDLYDLLSIPATASEPEIRRAYRKTSLLYHPDKVKPTPETLEKFQLLQSAIAILTDPAEKAKYDQSREAKQRRKAEREAMDSRRREMVEDLERREAAHQAARVAAQNREKGILTEKEMEIQRVREVNRKKMEEYTAKRKAEALLAEEQWQKEQVQTKKPRVANSQDTTEEDDIVHQSVQVRWIQEDDGLDLDERALTEMFPAGEVETVRLIPQSKKRKVDGRKKKVVLGLALIVFASVAAAETVVKNGPVHGLYSVKWMADKGEKEPLQDDAPNVDNQQDTTNHKRQTTEQKTHPN